jgi:predicted acyltransferase
MILVNNPGTWSHVYPPLRHAEWHGWTPTDFVFPFFLFIVGVAMTFSLPKLADNRAGLYLKILRRSAIIFGIGLFLNFVPDFSFSTLRIPGVLQRIAVVYLFASLITVNTGVKGQVYWFGGLLLSYWAMMKLIPVPGIGAGVLTPEGQLGAYIDNSILHGHMYRETWDPEGLLSTIPAIATTLSGVLTGHLLRSKKDKMETAGQLFVIGWVAIVAGLLWGIFFPINKAIWTSSYVIFTSGAALQFLAFCYWLIDAKGYQKWARPAIIFGMNSIAVYALAELMSDVLSAIPLGSNSLRSWIFENLFQSWASPINASLMFALAMVFFCFLVMAYLYKKRIFIRV